jgi:amino acid adenylation domain-containing protein
MVVDEAERHQLLVEWNATAVDYPSNQCIHQLFEAQAERIPAAVALVFEQQQLTYRELNQQANQLAHYLRQLGVGPEALVGICMERSLEMVVGLLGTLKAGGAYVPLDPAYPRERLAFMLEDARPTVLVTQQHLIERLPIHEQVVCLDTGWHVIGRESKENVLNGVRSENLAYMLYTSGSTGRPKGVLGTHRAAINRFHWMWNTYPFEPGEVCCQKTSLSFVDSVWEIFGPLLQGIRTVMIPDPVIKDPQQLLQTLAVHAVTRIVLVPSLLRVLLETAADLQNQLPNLKYWVSSGEALPLDLALRFLKSMPHSVLLNLYGSSEVAADVTCYDTQNYTSLPCIPIGRPIANTQIYLLDDQMQPVPVGVPGELYVSGDGLARGYFNRPELTAAKFVPNPFVGTRFLGPQPGARLYKTGDWARYLSDGNIEYLGRLDHQVKLRGMRIELGEIESVLARHPAVRQAVVMAREDVPGDTRLVAYVVCHEKQTTTLDDLQSHVLKHLPNYMVPSAFVLLEALPLTPSGKIDRPALPAPDQARPELQSAFVVARTPLEETIAGIWSQVLEVEQVGIHDNFFALGGHSLLAMQVISRLRATFQVEVPLQSFLEAPTVAQLTEILRKASGAKSRKPPLRSISREAYRVPSAPQSRGS